jgi:hypothetical protein
VNDLSLTNLGGKQVLVVAGNQGKRLTSLDPVTGQDTGYFTSVITDPLPNAWGGLAVYHFAIDPTSTHLVATGNFSTVEGQSRSKFFMLDLGASGAILNPWYYPGFAKRCSSTAPRRIAYLQDVDWSPDGTAFDITATGQVPATKADIWYHALGDTNNPNTTVCDAAGRFKLSDPTKPAWINYTGGDSVWVVADTGSAGAVYVQGHFKWLDNPDGIASKGTGDIHWGGGPAASRKGIGAIDPATGLALPWNPPITSQMGGKALEPTSSGLWIGDDSNRFGTETNHYGIAFAPLP